jgi:hypothetical protein
VVHLASRSQSVRSLTRLAAISTTCFSDFSAVFPKRPWRVSDNKVLRIRGLAVGGEGGGCGRPGQQSLRCGIMNI